MEADTLLADKAFNVDKRVIEPLRAKGKTVVVPPKSNRNYDKEIYKARYLIENFFCKFKQFRAIATRYDKQPEISWLRSSSPLLLFGSIEDTP